MLVAVLVLLRIVTSAGDFRWRCAILRIGADMVAETSAARAMVWQGARTWSPRQCVASMVKFHCTDTAMRVIEMGMDLMGEHALSHRARLEKIYRDARLTQIFEGTNQVNRLSVVEDLQEHWLTSPLTQKVTP